MNVVALIAKRFETDVCSAYLLEPDRANLVLAATVGLRPQCIGTLRLGLHEGLAGLVAEQVRPVAVEQVKNHPALQIFPRSRRRRLQSFLGVPLIDRGDAAGRSGGADAGAAAVSGRAKSACWRKRRRRWRPSSAKRARWTGSSRPRRNGCGRWRAICGGAGTTIRASLFLDLDPQRWRQLNHNPIALLAEIPLAKIERRAGELVLHGRINYAYRRQREYLEKRPHLGRTARGNSAAPPGGLFLGGVRAARIHSRSIPAAWEFSRAITSRALRTWGSRWSASACFMARDISGSISIRPDGSRKITFKPM